MVAYLLSAGQLVPGARFALDRWHPIEERWEDGSQPVPETASERATERQRLEADEMRRLDTDRCEDMFLSLTPSIRQGDPQAVRAVIGLAGLFVAHAWEEGAMHSAGIALFIVSAAIIFLDMKHVFDRMEPPGP